jgi:hypothetical protein
VHIVEANRIRRGGVGGFFATDLGVELVATNAVQVQDTRSAHDVIPSGAAPAALGRRPQFDNYVPVTAPPSADLPVIDLPVTDLPMTDLPVTGAIDRTGQPAGSPSPSALTLVGLERLIADVGRSERDTSHVEHHHDHQGPSEAISFADHLQRETELPTEPITLPLARRNPLATQFEEPIEPPARSYASLVRHVDETGWGERPDPIDLDAVHLAWTELVESIEAKSEATSKREWAAATAAKLRSRAVQADHGAAAATLPIRTPARTSPPRSTRTSPRTSPRTPTRTSIRKPLPTSMPEPVVASSSSPATAIEFADRPGSDRPEHLVASATAHIFEQLAALDTRSGGKLDCLRSLRVAVTMPGGANIEVTADLSLMAGDRA